MLAFFGKKMKRILRRLTKDAIRDAVDRLNFIHILAIWIVVIMLFGIIYHFLATGSSHLVAVAKGQPIDQLRDSVYFSFVTATTTGFGDIIPAGGFKVIAIFEVIFGLLLLALVTSKLVSIKQDIILNELYELSFNEEVYKLRSSLMLFRQNIDRVISRVEEGSLHRREISSAFMHFHSLEDVLRELLTHLKKSDGHHFVKTIDTTDTEIIVNSIINSFEKTQELVALMKEKGIEWKSDAHQSAIKRCIHLNESLFCQQNLIKNLQKETAADSQERNSRVIIALKYHLQIS